MNKFDKQHQLNVRKYQRKIDSIYKRTAEEAARRASSLPAPDDYIFTFDDFPATKKQIDALMATMAADIEMTVTDGIRAEWDLSNAKNDALVESVLGDAASLARYHRTHEDALNAFLERKQNGLGLSDRVWRYTNQFKDEIEMGLDLGIREGKDAASIARSIQQYLQYPDMLFRRVKDEHGVFQLSQRAAAFHPGQGVYRSSYKNALRLAATETNIAYRTADHERWQDLDFIVGIEVHLSNNHTVLNNKKERVELFDICDELQGRYPREFQFVGWHPNCRCIATQVFKTDKEMAEDDERLKRGEEPLDPHDSENAVTDMPDGFKQWMEDNAERLENAKSMPYFIRDNFVDGDPAQGLRWIVEKPLTPANESEPLSLSINVPQFAYITDSSKMTYIERVENLITGVVEADPSKKNWAELVRSMNYSEDAAKRNWKTISSYHTPDHLHLLETSKHITELKTADLSVIPEQWRGTMAELIERINVHDIAKNGYQAIYSEIEHAYNIYKLSTTSEAIEYGLAKLSDKTPYNIFTELRKKIPDFGIPEKAFFDRFEKFVPMLTTNKGAYYSSFYGHVNIGISDADNLIRLRTSKWWRQGGMIHHEYTHALDAQKGLFTNPELIKIYDDWARRINKEQRDSVRKGGRSLSSLEIAIEKILKEKRDAFNAVWEKSAKKAELVKACENAKTFEECKKANKALQNAYRNAYAEELYDFEEKLGALSDCVGAANSGVTFVEPRGHSGAYFRARNNQLKEFVAHIGENYWSGNPYFKELAPQLYEAMLKWYDGL